MGTAAPTYEAVLATFLDVATERYANDPDYRARLQRDLFQTDSTIAQRVATYDAARWNERTPHAA